MKKVILLISFEKSFKKAKDHGFHITMHCDVDQENSIEHIRQVLEDIGVERVDHGTNIVENSKLVDFALEKRYWFYKLSSF